MKLSCTLIASLSLILAAAPLAAHSPEVEAKFEATYGKAVRGVRGTRTSSDDADLAAILYTDAQRPGESSEFLVKLYEQTYDLGKLHTSGYKVAADALQQLCKLEPRRTVEMQENLLTLYEIVFRNSAGPAKEQVHKKAGNATVDLILEIVEGKKKRAEYSAAIALLTKGQGIGRTVGSPHVDSIAKQIQELKPLAVIDLKVQAAKRALAKDGKDKDAAQTLTDLYLKDLDRPLSAKTYAELLGDKAALEKMTLAGQPVDALPGKDAAELAAWYAAMGNTGFDTAKKNVLIRAKMYYERALEQDAANAGHKAELAKVDQALSALKVSGTEATALARSRRDRLGITVAARPTPPKPQPTPVTPKPVTPKPVDPVKPVQPVQPAQPPPPKPADPPAMVQPKEVEPEYQDEELSDEYWRKRKSIFDF